VKLEIENTWETAMSSRPALSIVDHDQSAREGIAPRALATRVSGHSVLTAAAALARFHLEPGFEGRPDLRSVDTDEPLFRKRANPADQALSEISFGPFRLLPAQFLLLEGDKSVSLGSRALEILVALLERPGGLVTKQELMDRVWPNVFVEPANLTVHISALRRALRDGRDGNRFIINIPGRGYRFVASIQVSMRQS
jgi:DNA-binding winged helix-turn-helix (wHTH) protein